MELDFQIEAYRSFLSNIEHFKEMNSLPTAIIFGEHESAESFSANHASWQEFGVNKSINKTRLKNDVLESFPESQEQQDGKSTVIVFRGKGIRRKVSGQTKLPGKWMDFLGDSDNKKELFAFITSKVAEFTFQPGKAVYITSGESVVSVGSGISNMLECNHEEADTRIVVQIVHALQQGMKRIEVRTVDTDVIVILAGAYYKLAMTYPLADIWVAFGKGKFFKFYSINYICLPGLPCKFFPFPLNDDVVSQQC